MSENTDNSFIAPIRVEIRSDGPYVRARLAMSDGSESVEIGRINRHMIEDVPCLFDKWKDLCTTVMAHAVATADCKVTEVMERQVMPPDIRRN